MAFVKRLTFESIDLGIDVDLLLTFDDQPDDGMYKKYYPSAFAVRRFGAEGTFRSDIIYRSQLAFTKVDNCEDVIHSTSIVGIPIDVGQSTILTKEGQVYHFSDPKTDSTVPKNNIQCTNNTPFKEDIGVGFIAREGDAPKTTLVWRGVEYGQKLNAEFTPVLRGYIGTGYHENGLIPGQVVADRLFREDLDHLEDRTTWVVKYDTSTGVVSINRK
ncbi:hypothetical protein BDR03DRAFT_1001792 [Suillus americanus]|nr:hypothetical protein BDR03DRAFT_1001792 [Suillus americanus]